MADLWAGLGAYLGKWEPELCREQRRAQETPSDKPQAKQPKIQQPQRDKPLVRPRKA